MDDEKAEIREDAGSNSDSSSKVYDKDVTS